jgi:hypothetical protein
MISEERKHRQLQQLGRKESTFLRLRRTRLGLDDFRTVKVIGKGAFGEVSSPVNVVDTHCTVILRAGQAGPEDRHR